MLAISIAMWIRRYDAGRIAQWSASVLHAKPLDATIGQVPALYCPGGRHGRRFQKKKTTNKTQLLRSFCTVDRQKKAIKYQDPWGPILMSLARLGLTLTFAPLVKLKF